MANYYTQQFFGAAQTCINQSATDTTAGNFNTAPAATFTNNDATIGCAPFAVAMLECDFGTNPVAGTTIELWGNFKDVDSTDDDLPIPTAGATTVGAAQFFASFPLSAITTVQRITRVISLEGVGNGITVDFWLRNGSAQSIDVDAGINLVLKVTPFCYGVTV